MLEFGQTIKARREQKGLTQKQLGQLLYVSDKTVSRWENNQIYPDITMLLDISKVLEIDYQQLIEGSDYIEKKKAKQEKQMKQRKKGLFCFVCFILSVLLVCSYSFLLDEKIKETGIDYIVSRNWKEIGMSDEDETGYSIYSIYLLMTDYQKEKVVSFLDIDHWIRVDTLPEGAKNVSYQIGFYTQYRDGSYKSEEYRTYLKDNTYYLVMYQDPSIVYQLPINPTQLANFYKTISDTYYTYDHPFENLTSYPVFSQEIINWNSSGRSNLSINDDIGCVQVPNEEGWYFLLHSSTFDIQTVDIEENVLYITGEKRSYNSEYMIGLKVDEEIHISKVYMNDELICDYENGIFDMKE